METLQVSKTRYQFKNKLSPTSQEINRDFLIRWKTSDELPGYSNLISAGKYAEKFGNDYMLKHFTKVWESGQDRMTFKIRGLYIITFIAR